MTEYSDYHVLAAESSAMLAAIVNDFFNHSYVPVGGVYVLKRDSSEVWAQAVAKPKPEVL